MSIKRSYQQLKNVYHLFQSHFWRLYYGKPDKCLKIYGVTGTNGKTTTCVVLGSILREKYGKDKVGLLTTIIFWFGKKEQVNKTKMTTLDSRDIFKYLHKMKKAGIKHVALEVTSHALDQNRLAGIKLDGAIILNLTREHLDYHKTLEDYAQAKIKIASFIKHNSPIIINEEFPITNYQFPKLRVITFNDEQENHTSTPLLGDWNKENALAASLLAKEIGLNNKTIQKGILAVKQVPGRMEFVETKNEKGKTKNNNAKLKTKHPKVIIDYAVTPNALENVYQEVKKQTDGKIFAVLGACGLRDRGKRPDMAKVVAKYADELILTREDPWTEDEEQIFTDLEQGLKNTQTKWSRIVDRREAIKHCLQKATLNDIIVVTGKGAEVGMKVGDKLIPWSDKQVILELLEEVKKTIKIKSPNEK